MPKAEIRKRGGAIRVRTVILPDGRRATVYIVRKRGPKGGRTVLGEPRTRAKKGM